MATPNQYVQTPTFYLAGSGTIVGATTVAVTSFTDIYGNALIMSSFGTTGYGTLEPDTSNEEGFTFTSVTANDNGSYTLGGVSTILAESPYTQTSGLIRQHNGGQKVVITDNVAFWNTFANKANDEIITGNWTFNTVPTALGVTRATTTVLGNVKLTSISSTTLGTATITIASPAVVTFASHGLISGDSVQFTTTGALPTGISASTNYYVIATGLTTNTFEISATIGGSAINTSGTQSGTQTLVRTTPFAVSNDDPRLPTVGEGQALAGTAGTPSSSNKYITQLGTTTTPSGGLVPQLDSSGYIPLALDQNRNIYVTSGSVSVTTSASNLVITHSLGVIPKLIKITAISGSGGGIAGSANSNSISIGTSTTNTSGSVTSTATVASYMSLGNAGSSYFQNNASDYTSTYIIDLNISPVSGSSFVHGTVIGVTSSTVTISCISQATNNIYYMAEITC